MLHAVVLTQYRRVTDRRIDGIAVANTALAMRALRRDVKTLTNLFSSVRHTDAAKANHDEGDDNSKQADSAAKDFDNENFDEQRLVLRVGQRAARPDHTDAQTAREVAEASNQSSAEHQESCTQAPRLRSLQAHLLALRSIRGRSQQFDWYVRLSADLMITLSYTYLLPF